MCKEKYQYPAREKERQVFIIIFVPHALEVHVEACSRAGSQQLLFVHCRWSGSGQWDEVGEGNYKQFCSSEWQCVERERNERV